MEKSVDKTRCNVNESKFYSSFILFCCQFLCLHVLSHTETLPGQDKIRNLPWAHPDDFTRETHTCPVLTNAGKMQHWRISKHIQHKHQTHMPLLLCQLAYTSLLVSFAKLRPLLQCIADSFFNPLPFFTFSLSHHR